MMPKFRPMTPEEIERRREQQAMSKRMKEFLIEQGLMKPAPKPKAPMKRRQVFKPLNKPT